MIQAGLISEDDLKQMTITGGLVSSTPQRIPQQNPTMGQQQQPSRKLRVVGYGNGQATDLGEEDWQAPAIDYTRPGIDVPGVGKGNYGADGRSAYVQTPQGMTKVLLGYDAEASDRRNDMALKREAARTQLEQEGLQNEGLRQRNAMLAAGPQQTMNDAPQGAMVPSQKALNDFYGKAPDGKRWTADGKLELIPDGNQKVADAQDVLAILDQAEPLLEQSTGSYGGAAIDQAARVFGHATDGAKAAAQLKALQGTLVSKMPKMSGPQSDKDVLLYKEMAGQIGDPTIPAEQKRAAMQTIRELNTRYAGGGTLATPAGKTGRRELDAMPMAHQYPGKLLTTPDGQRFKSDGKTWVRQ
jgi:hypothetical protein